MDYVTTYQCFMLVTSKQVGNTILKSNRALNAIRLVKSYFTNKELLQILTSNFYSVLYYNSEIWHLPSLSVNLKQKLFSASAIALKTCTKINDLGISYHQYHVINNRATPDKLLEYKHALSLYKLYNDSPHSLEWLALNNNQILTSRSVGTFRSKNGKFQSKLS